MTREFFLERMIQPLLMIQRVDISGRWGLSASTNIICYWQQPIPQITFSKKPQKTELQNAAGLFLLKLNTASFWVEKWGCSNFSSSFWRPERIPDKFHILLDFLNSTPGIDCHLNSTPGIDCQSFKYWEENLPKWFDYSHALKNLKMPTLWDESSWPTLPGRHSHAASNTTNRHP